MPEPVGQIPVQATVLCSRLAASPASQSECSLNITQLALLKARDQPTSVFFEASMTFNAYPWPTWSSASGSLVVDQGMSSLMVLNPLKSSQTTWAARYNTGLLIKLTPKGVVFSFHFSDLLKSSPDSSTLLTCSPASSVVSSHVVSLPFKVCFAACATCAILTPNSWSCKA